MTSRTSTESTAPSSTTCSGMCRVLGAHLDGQLDPLKTLEVEEHLGACEPCRERLALDRAMRGSLKRATKTAAPDSVRGRLMAAMIAEGDRASARSEAGLAADDGAAGPGEPAAPEGARATGNRSARPSMLRHWRTMLPLASAAALALAWGSASRQPVGDGGSDVMRGAIFGGDDLLHDLVAQHSREYPPEQTDPTQVRQLSRYVGVPVRVPRLSQGHFVGGRLVPMHRGEAAAMLQYQIDQQGKGVKRVTIFVYNPRNVQVDGAHLSPRAVGTAEVRVGQTDGYSVAVTQRAGVGYTIASDLDPEDSVLLANVVDHD